MDEGFDFHWYAGKAPYFVAPDGKELYCKLRRRVPVIGDGSIAAPAKDEENGSHARRPGNSGFWPFSGLARHAGAAESDREEESSDKSLQPKILKALKETMPLKIDSDFMTKAGWVSHPILPQMIVGHFPMTFRTPATRYPRHVIRTTWVFNKKWVEIEKEVDIRTLDNRVAKLPSELQFFLSRSLKDPLMTQNRNLTVIKKLKLCQMTKSVQPSSSCRPEVWNTSLRTVPKTLSARYVKRPKC